MKVDTDYHQSNKDTAKPEKTRAPTKHKKKEFFEMNNRKTRKELAKVIQNIENYIDVDTTDRIKADIKKIVHDVQQRRGVVAAVKLKQILAGYTKRIAVEKYDIGQISGVEYTVSLIDPNQQPISQRAYRTNLAKKEEIRKNVAPLLKHGLIRKSKSPWVSPVLIVQNGDGSTRLCIDYSKINKLTKKDHFPCPNVDDTLNMFHGKTIYSKLDIAKAFFNIAVAEDSKKYTAFVTEEGCYEWNVMPFGGANCPSVWARASDHCFRGMKDLIKYVDDFTIASQAEGRLSDVDVQLNSLTNFFDRLEENNLKIKISKSEFLTDQCEFLGNVITPKGRNPTPKYTQKLLQFTRPTTRKELQAWKGAVNWVARYIFRIKHLMTPFRDISKENTTWKWTALHESAFKKVQMAVNDCRLLHHPDFTKEFVIQCDASGKAYGGVLLQKRGDKYVPIEFYSRLFNDPQVRWHITTKEIHAMIECIKHWNVYLHLHFTVHTDAKNIIHLEKRTRLQGNVNPMHYRWIKLLNSYAFTVLHIKGVDNVIADFLSRYVDYEKVDTYQGAGGKKPIMSEKQMKEESDRIGRIYRQFALNRISDPANTRGSSLNYLKNEGGSYFLRIWMYTQNELNISSPVMRKRVNKPLVLYTPKLNHYQIKLFEDEHNGSDHESCFILRSYVDHRVPQTNPPIKRRPKRKIQRRDYNDDHLHIGTGQYHDIGTQQAHDILKYAKNGELTKKQREKHKATISKAKQKSKIDQRRTKKSARKEKSQNSNLSNDEKYLQDLQNRTDAEQYDGQALKDFIGDEVTVLDLMQDDALLHDKMFDLPILIDQQKQDAYLSIIRDYVSKKRTDIELIDTFSPRTVGDIRSGRYYLTADGALAYKRKRRLLVLPPTHRMAFMKYYHENIRTGLHQGKDAMIALLKQYYYWPGYTEDIKSFIGSCHICQMQKAHRSHHIGKMQLFPAKAFNERISIDHAVLPVSKQGNRYITSIIDAFTGYVISFPARTLEAVETVQNILNHWVCVYGAPQRILSDQGSDFMSKIMQHFLKTNAMKHLRTTPYHPQTDGQVERWNRTMKCGLRVIGDMKGINQFKDELWDIWLPTIFAHHNASISRRTNCTPNSLLFAHKFARPDHGLHLENDEFNELKNATGYDEYADLIKGRINILTELAGMKLKKYNDARKEIYDKAQKEKSFKVNDLVLCFHGDFGPSAERKLTTPWRGPYRVIYVSDHRLNYNLKHCQNGNERYVNIKNLFPYTARTRFAVFDFDTNEYMVDKRLESEILETAFGIAPTSDDEANQLRPIAEESIEIEEKKEENSDSEPQDQPSS